MYKPRGNYGQSYVVLVDGMCCDTIYIATSYIHYVKLGVSQLTTTQYEFHLGPICHIRMSPGRSCSIVNFEITRVKHVTLRRYVQ